ncbi:MAG: AAA family ATPase [Bacteroidales bacterium]
MENIDKNKVKELFEAKRKRLNFSYAQAASAAGTKSSTLSQVFSGKYPANDEGIYKLLAHWVGYDTQGWKLVATINYQFIQRTIMDARQNSHMYALVGSAGSGKTVAQKQFASEYPNSFLIRCDEFWTRQQFLQEVLTQMGRDPNGQSIAQMINMITKVLLQLDRPVLMFDEADKLSNAVFQMFISLYNRLEDNCGIVLTATEHLTRRLEKGLARNLKGYAEMWSRIGRKPVECISAKFRDIKEICQANGFDDEHQIKLIAQESQGDLRRVKRACHKYRLATESVN